MIVQSCKNHRQSVKLKGKEASINFMTYQEPEREQQRMQSIRDELVERIATALPEDGVRPVHGHATSPQAMQP